MNRIEAVRGIKGFMYRFHLLINIPHEIYLRSYLYFLLPKFNIIYFIYIFKYIIKQLYFTIILFSVTKIQYNLLTKCYLNPLLDNYIMYILYLLKSNIHIFLNLYNVLYFT